jgi:hypothetical protein
MYCHKCGAKLVEREGELYCTAGDMGVSDRLRLRVAELLRSRSGTDTAPLFDYRLHSDAALHCPGCGGRLRSDLACTACAIHLRSLVHDMVELHPHT